MAENSTSGKRGFWRNGPGFVIAILATIVIGIEILVCVTFALFVVFGGYPMGADVQPGAVETWAGGVASNDWESAQAPNEKDPVAVNDQTLESGARLYQANCAVCHGGANYRTSPLHKGVYPGAPQFMQKAPSGGSNNDKLFYVVRHGIRFTGMPAWRYSMSDTDIWKAVNFLTHMDHLPPGVEQAWQQMPMSAEAASAVQAK